MISNTKIYKFEFTNVQKKAIIEFNYDVYNGLIQTNEVNRCFCKSNSLLTLNKFDRFGLPFGTQICKDCGLVSSTRQINESSLERFYNLYYWPLIMGKKLDSNVEGWFMTPTKHDEKESYVLPYVNMNKKELTIFEIGCGAGARITKLKSELISKNIKVHAIGCDYSEGALKFASKKGITTVLGGIDKISLYGKADVLIMSHVFEHFNDLYSVMSHISDILCDDGLIYIEVPGVNDLVNKAEYNFDYQRYSVLAHTYNFSLGSLVNVMGAVGYELVDGDEFVRSVFRKTTKKIKFINQYEKTISSLRLAEDKKNSAIKNNNLIKLIGGRLIKKIKELNLSK